MAACLITISGTNGLLRLDYKIGLDSYSINTSIGTLYIEDTATDVTYTILKGDLIASSGCLTIIELPLICYNIHWNEITLNNWKVDEIIIGINSYVIENISFPNSEIYLCKAINNLNIDSIKALGYESIYESSTNTYAYNYILSILGSDIPQLKITNADSTMSMYIVGTILGTCDIPLGYREIEVCYNGFAITTTTTSI